MDALDYFQREAEEWKEIHEKEFGEFLSWKIKEGEDVADEKLEPVLVDVIVSAVNEYTHMVHRGAMSNAIALAVKHMTVSERELLFLFLNAFGQKRNSIWRFSIPQTGASHFYLTKKGELSSQFTKMNHVPGISLLFSEALSLVWFDKNRELVQLFRQILTVLGGFWGDFVRNNKFGGCSLEQWIQACVELLEECVSFCFVCVCVCMFFFFG